jgi:probable rRNA maturation factor
MRTAQTHKTKPARSQPVLGDFSCTYTTAAVEKQVRRLASHKNTASEHTTLASFEASLRDVAEKILGASYECSLVFSDEKKIQQLNVQYRQKDYVPNVLSFPLSDTAGEVYICPTIAEKEAPQYSHTPSEHMRYLFIHGCLHLTGLDHGAKMDRLEYLIN